MKVHADGVKIDLWNNKIPNNLVVENMEQIHSKEDGDVHYTFVTHPSIEVFPVESERLAPVVVICPGGGYWLLSYNKEGTDIARFLNRHGIAAVVLKYRIPNKEYQDDPSIAPLQDAQRAIQLVRSHSEDWNMDPEHVGIMGFSAGGHLASTVSHHWKKPVIENVSPSMVRPDFTMLVYPLITFAEKHTHVGCLKKMLGDFPVDWEKRVNLSAEKQVDLQTPPAFLVQAFDDYVSIQNSIDYMIALRKFKIPCEVHFYQKGGHGYGLKPGYTDGWGPQLIKWIHMNCKDGSKEAEAY